MDPLLLAVFKKKGVSRNFLTSLETGEGSLKLEFVNRRSLW